MSYTINHTIKCCKGCVAPKRHPGCHDHCPEYIAEKAEYDAKKAEAYKMKAIRERLDGQQVAAVYRAKKYRGGKV